MKAICNFCRKHYDSIILARSLGKESAPVKMGFCSARCYTESITRVRVPKKFNIPSIDAIPDKHRDKIESISDERNNGDGLWIYLYNEYADFDFDPQNPTSQIHEQTLKEAIIRIKRSKPIHP